MKPNDAALRIGIHVNTVRTWTMNEFKQFFSVHAQGGDGRTRDLSDDDVRVLAYINDLKRRGLGSQDVIASLIAAEKRGFHLLPYPERSEHVAPMAVVPRQSAEDAVSNERRIMAAHIGFLEQRVEELKTELEDVRKNADERTDSLTRKLIEAETELRLWRSGWRPPTNGVGE